MSGFFTNLFATRRELKRLLKSEQFWRERALALEKKLESERNEYLERHFLTFDRFLVAKEKAFPITDEVRHNIELKDNDLMARKEDEELKTYLQRKKEELYEDALEANQTLESADRLFALREQSYIEAFKEAGKFH